MTYIDRVRLKAPIKLQVNNTTHFYTVPQNNAGNLNRAKVLKMSNFLIIRLITWSDHLKTGEKVFEFQVFSIQMVTVVNSAQCSCPGLINMIWLMFVCSLFSVCLLFKSHVLYGHKRRPTLRCSNRTRRLFNTAGSWRYERFVTSLVLIKLSGFRSKGRSDWLFTSTVETFWKNSNEI